MKKITIIAEQVSDRALTAALPANGIASVILSRHDGAVPHGVGAEDQQILHAAGRFNPTQRIELFVEEAAVESVFDGVAIAYSVGMFSAAEMWVDHDALPTAA